MVSTNTSFWGNDIKSGITVFLVAVPLCLGIALASGVPVLAGLIAGIVGGIVVGLASGSHVSVSGPAAGLVAIILAATQELGSFNMFLTATMMAGVLQILFGYLNIGIVAHYIPHSVVKGMLAAIGVILILKQIPHVLGYDGAFGSNLFFNRNAGDNIFSESFAIFNNLSWGAVVISLFSFLLLYVFSFKNIQKKKMLKFIPVSLIVILVGAIANKIFSIYFPWLTISGKHLVQIPSLFFQKEFLDSIVFPDFSAFSLFLTYKYAFIIAIIASVETLLCIEASDKLDPHRRITPTSRELKAQGLGNFVSGLCGGLPITSVIVRSSVNIESKSKTKRSTIIHGVLLIFSLLVASPLINTIPIASLACILIVVGYKLTNKTLVREMFQKGVDQFAPFVITIITILLTDLLIGVFVGLMVSAFLVLRNYYKLQNFKLTGIPGEKNSYQVTFSRYITFLSKASLQKSLALTPPGSRVEFNFEETVMIDHEVREMLDDYYMLAKEKKIEIKIKNSVKDIFRSPENLRNSGVRI